MFDLLSFLLLYEPSCRYKVCSHSCFSPFFYRFYLALFSSVTSVGLRVACSRFFAFATLEANSRSCSSIVSAFPSKYDLQLSPYISKPLLFVSVFTSNFSKCLAHEDHLRLPLHRSLSISVFPPRPLTYTVVSATVLP
jgi:hypothetical protein